MPEEGCIFLYEAFGLNLKSELYFPELIKINKPSLRMFNEDVFITIGDAPELSNKLYIEKEYFAAEELVMFEVPDIATFTIKEGRKIIVTPYKNFDEDIVRLYVLGTCMGAILMQRLTFPLHGSVVAIDGKAYAFIGNQRAGKSTLASAMLKQGHKLLSDDIIALKFFEDNAPFVIPSYPQRKLWDDTLDYFGMNNKNYRSIYGRENKFFVPSSSTYHKKSLPLEGIFELTRSDEKDISFSLVSNLERLPLLFHHTYRNFLVEPLGLKKWHFNMTAKLATQVDTYRIKRPVSRFTPHEIADEILNIIQKEEISL